MKCVTTTRGFPYLSSIAAFPQPLHCATKLKKSSFRITAKLSGDDDPLLQAAIHGTSLRFQETHRPEPLFHDPYVASLVPENTPMDDLKQETHPYCIAIRFIDEKLLQALRNTDELKQVVLLTDGVDTRPYRLTWPTSTLIFDVSPDRIYTEACQKLKDIGAQIPRSCFFLHVPLESSSIQEAVQSKGFNGNRPSIWVLQGLPLMTLASFEDILFTVDSLATKGCFLIGEIPAWLAETQLELKTTREEWLHKLFMSHGFQVQMIDYEDVARSLGREPSKEPYDNVLFVAEHVRFSDDQMETWRREFQRAEDEGDEDGFEDL